MAKNLMGQLEMLNHVHSLDTPENHFPSFLFSVRQMFPTFFLFSLLAVPIVGCRPFCSVPPPPPTTPCPPQPPTTSLPPPFAPPVPPSASGTSSPSPPATHHSRPAVENPILWLEYGGAGLCLLIVILALGAWHNGRLGQWCRQLGQMGERLDKLGVALKDFSEALGALGEAVNS